jgi:hypothetical protein
MTMTMKTTTSTITTTRCLISGLLAGLLGFTGCVADDEDLQLSETDAELFFDSATRWPTSNIPVCWETGGYGMEKEWVRQAIGATWQKEANVHFTGWGQCPWNLTGSYTLRIKVADETDNPHTSGLGIRSALIYNSMTLNFTFQNWSPGCQSNRENCIKQISIHEFGHALGFAHEHLRSDAWMDCSPKQGNTGDTFLGPWDVESVMNYCNNANWSGRLSRGDIIGVQTVYGKRATSIIGPNAKCLGAPFGIGGDNRFEHCAGRNDQKWSMPLLTSFPTPISNRSNGWLDVSYSQTGNGAGVRTYYKNNPSTANQLWNLQNVALRGLGGSCLDVPYASSTPGTYTQLFPCNSGAAQQWTFTPSGELRTPAGKCLDAQWGSTADGTPIWIWDCNGGAAQKWKWYGPSIQGPGGKCLEVADGNGTTGSRIQLATCNGSLKQRWSVVGKLRTALAGARCLNSASSQFDAGSTILFDCNPSAAPADTFEFYP